MPKQAAHQQYKQIQVKTANKGKLVVMLYQGCIKFLKLAKESIENEKLEEANNYIIRSQDIISELMNTLDMERGGEIASNLYQLYDFMNRKLIDANVKKDKKKLEIVENMLLELLDSWKQITERKKNQNKQNSIDLKK